MIVVRDDKIVSAGSHATTLAVCESDRPMWVGSVVVARPLGGTCTFHPTGDPKMWAGPVVALSMPRVALIGAKNARLTVEAGFTTVRDVGRRRSTDIALRDAINAGDVPGLMHGAVWPCARYYGWSLR